MSHLTYNTGYSSLIERLNRFPQGAPPSELLARILSLLLTDQEADLVSRLPVHPFSAAMAARLWGIREVAAFRTLEGLADRALLLDIEHEEEKIYLLPPPMAGFFQYAMMRVRSDVDQKRLGELLYQYLHMGEEFIVDLYLEGDTRYGRVLAGEEEIPQEYAHRVLSHERASEVVKGAWKISVGTCCCRQKMQHIGKSCSATLELCMTFDTVADSLIRHGHAREISKAECLDLLQLAREQNLVQFAENVQGGVTFLCNCCGCCCHTMLAARKFWDLAPIHTSNFISEVKPDLCSGCGRCIDVCPVEAVSLVSANNPEHPWMRKCVQDPDRCLGCGVCARVCNNGAVSLLSREERVLTPVNGTHRLVQMALERGKLQHLLWDNQALFSHRAMAAVIGAILRMPPVKQALACSQLGSRYLHTLVQKRVDLPKHRPYVY